MTLRRKGNDIVHRLVVHGFRKLQLDLGMNKDRVCEQLYTVVQFKV